MDLNEIAKSVIDTYYKDEILPSFSYYFEIPESVLSLSLEPRDGSKELSLLNLIEEELSKKPRSEEYVGPLTCLSDQGFIRASKLLFMLYTKIGDTAKADSALARYNSLSEQVKTAIPAACIDFANKRISIHPYFQKARAPIFVIKFLIHHELNHYLSGSTTHSSEQFIERESQFNKKDESLAWIKKNGFPTA